MPLYRQQYTAGMERVKELRQFRKFLYHSDCPCLPLNFLQIRSITLKPPPGVIATAAVTWSMVTFLSVPYIMQFNHRAINLIATWGT